MVTSFYLNARGKFIFQGVSLLPIAAIAAVGTEQSRIRLPGVGDDRAVLKAQRGPVGFCCLRALRQTFSPFFLFPAPCGLLCCYSSNVTCA